MSLRTIVTMMTPTTYTSTHRKIKRGEQQQLNLKKKQKCQEKHRWKENLGTKTGHNNILVKRDNAAKAATAQNKLQMFRCLAIRSSAVVVVVVIVALRRKFMNKEGMYNKWISMISKWVRFVSSFIFVYMYICSHSYWNDWHCMWKRIYIYYILV